MVKGGRGWQQEVREVRCAGRSTKMILKRTYLFLIFVILGFNSEVKTMLSNMPLNRRPSMLEGGRGGQQEVRGDRLG